MQRSSGTALGGSNNARELIAFSKNAANDGTSVWIVQGRTHKLSLMKSRVKGIPQLNSNDVYMVLSMRHNVSILGDRPYTNLRASFWVGSRALNHQ